VHTGRPVLLEEEDRPPAVRHEMLADAREETTNLDTRVLGARVLGNVVRAKGEEIADLLSFDVNDAKRSPARTDTARPCRAGT